MLTKCSYQVLLFIKQAFARQTFQGREFWMGWWTSYVPLLTEQSVLDTLDHLSLTHSIKHKVQNNIPKSQTQNSNMWKEWTAMNPAPLFPSHFPKSRGQTKNARLWLPSWKLSKRLCSQAPDASELQAFSWTLETTGSTVRDTMKTERVEKWLPLQLTRPVLCYSSQIDLV